MFHVTPREAVSATSNRSHLLIRAHREIQYNKGVKVPLSMGPGKKSPMAIKVIGAIKRNFQSITEAEAKMAGFDSLEDFQRHWRTQIYAKEGIFPASGDALKGGDFPVVLYRFKRDDEFVQRRIRVVE